MDKKTRVLNCIDNKTIDKVPCCFWHHYQGEDAVGKTCIEAHKKLYDETNIDFIKMMSDGYYGKVLDFGPEINKPSDWDKIKIPSMDSSYVTEQVDRVKWMIDAVQDECCIHYVLFSALTYLLLYYGQDFCVEQLKDPESNPSISGALKNMTEFIGELGTKLMEDGGATGIHQAIGWNYLFSEEEYRAWLRPNDEYLINTFNKVTPYSIVHLCGWEGYQNIMSTWSDYKANVLHWDQHTDKLPIDEAKVIFKNARSLMGGFDNKENTLLYTGSKEEIQEVAKNYARNGGKTGFILSADCSVLENISYERIRWVVDAMDELAEEK